MMKNRKIFVFDKNVKVTGFVSLFMDISSEMIYPIIPLFLVNVLGVNKSIIGLIEGVAETTANLLKVFSGWFSDRIGNRKWLMVIGYGISTLSRPILVFAITWHHVMGFRFIDRLGKGIRTAPRDAIIVESSKNEYLGRAFGFNRAMDTLGAVVGPLLALVFLGLFPNDYRKVFLFSIIPGIIAVLLIVFFITEKQKALLKASEKPKLTIKHFDWRFKFFIAIAGLFSLGNLSNVFLILRAENVGISVSFIPLIYLLYNLIYSLSAIPAGMIADRYGRKRIILLGFILFGALYYGFAIVSDIKTMWILFGLYGLFMGLTEGVQKAFLSTIIPQDFKATAFGLYNSVIGATALPASLIGGWLWDNISPSATFYFGTTTASISAILFVFYIVLIRKHNS